MAGNAVGSGVADGAAGPAPEDRADRAAASAAVEDLFREHWLELVRLALMMVGDRATAEDVVQDAFERFHRGWHSLREPANGLAYVRSSVLNGCRSVHRRSAVSRKYRRWLLPVDVSTPDAATGVDDSAEVVAMLRRLSRRQREVIVLRYYADLDVTEIARTLRITPGAVRTTISRALAAMACALRED